MNTINLNNFPIFAPNQILTAEDLNGLVNYLESLNQLTLTHFVGMGIAYGLEVRHLSDSTNPTKSQIQITPGFGITSEGYVIQVTPETEAKNTFTHYNNITIAGNLLMPGASSEQNYSVIELFSSQEIGTKVLPLAKEDELKDPVVVVFYNWQDSPRSETCQLSYDDQSGTERKFYLRFFVLPATSQKKENTDPSKPTKLSADQLLRSGYGIDRLSESEPWQTFVSNNGIVSILKARDRFFKKFNLRIQRFGYVDKQNVDLTKITDYTAWRDNYLKICKAAIEEIKKTFPELFRLFSPFFSSFHPNSKQDFNNLAQLDNWLNLVQNTAANADPPYALQYFYDYLSQLVAAYHELVEAAFDLMDDSAPDTEKLLRFPRFLMLGKIPPLNEPPQGFEVSSAYRSQFIQPRIYNNNQYRVKQVRHLYERLCKLCNFAESFSLLPFYKAPIKITPSKDPSVPLSEQAIPYYLNYSKLYQYWNYDAYRKGQSYQQPAYFASHDDLLYRLDAYNFYRIEGHIGKDKTVALNRICEYRQHYNLAFDIILLKLSSLTDLTDPSLLGQLNALNTDFREVKKIFQKLWDTHQNIGQNTNQKDWSKNVFLCTLKKVFFDQPDLSSITYDQLYNPILAAVRSDTQGDIDPIYQFKVEKDADNKPTGQYRLFIRYASKALAHCTFETGQDFKTVTELLDFSGLSDAQIIEEENRITSALSTSLSMGQFTYGVEIKPQDDINHYYLSLSITDNLNLPIRDSATGNPMSTVAAIKLISENGFNVSQQDNIPLVDPPAFRNFETLYGLLRDIPNDYATQNGIDFEMGNHEVAIDYINAFELNAFELKDRIETYLKYVEQHIALLRFHTFAQYHPGMKHLGGVPEGGTFILVYADDKVLAHNSLLADSERKNKISPPATLPPAALNELETLRDFKNWQDIIVADYCLPYRCGSDALNNDKEELIPLSPLVLLEKTSFCADDSNQYEFLLYPLNGNLKGEGSFFKSGKYYFQPNKIQQSSASDLPITFTYTVDGCYNTLVVTLHPLPDASFQLGEWDRNHFCHDHAPINLIAKYPNGKFHVEGDPKALKLDVNPPQFLPREVILGQEEQEKVITLTYTVTSEQGCTHEAQRAITIHALPDAHFKVGDSNTINFCADIASVQLIPNQPNGVFRALDGNRDISARVLQFDSNGDRFLPSAVNLGEDSEKKITLEYTVTSDQCCSSHSEPKIITIHRVPVGDFTAKISHVSTEGVTVQVSEIKPVGQPSYSYNFDWETPSGTHHSHKTSDNFEIFYNFEDFKNVNKDVDNAQLAITLRVTTPSSLGSCTSEPVTKIPLGAVYSLNLVTIDPTGEASVRLSDNQKFKSADFNSDNTYTFEAVVLGQVDQVNFTYEAPNAQPIEIPTIKATSLLHKRYHFRMIDILRQSWRWQPLVGKHEITAHVFQEVSGGELEGLSLTISLTIEEDGEVIFASTNPTSPPTNPTSPSMNPPNTPNFISPPANPNTPNLFHGLGNFLQASIPSSSSLNVSSPSFAIASHLNSGLRTKLLQTLAVGGHWFTLMEKIGETH